MPAYLRLNYGPPSGNIPTLKRPEKLIARFRARPLTRLRILLALAIAVAADGAQVLLGPLGWVLIDQAIDCVAMILVSWVIGFHVVLLPTFVVELVPLVDELPTWTACTAAVIAWRKREQRAALPTVPPAPPPIDI